MDGPAGRLEATEAAVTRFRTALEGSRSYRLAGRLQVKPGVDVACGHDGGDGPLADGIREGGEPASPHTRG